MTGILEFIGNPTVQSTALLTMAITALLAALPKPGTISIKNFTDFVAVLYKFAYDWTTGFWSMKTGVIPPSTAHIQTSEQTPTSSKIQDATFVSASDPTPPVAIPALTAK